MNAPAAGQKRLVIVGASGMVGGYGGALGSGCGDFLPRYVYRSVSDAELRKVTVDYAIEFARVLRGSSPDVAFSFLSGSGADQMKSHGFRPLQGRGRESPIRGGVSPRLHFRPAYIYPVEARKEPNFSYRLLRAVYPAFRMLFPNQVIPADELGRAMVDVPVRGTAEREARIFKNRDIRAMVKF